ncbi:zinc finger protein 260-like isoform X3 [Plodia interpunctella]|uniref:zinc finger protein 260-like isoform X3 n=1 Tax=Plodia interpunctella TaxID=58824 RepID=UPI002368A452|nr:zinc finger protein 260-like isoform X4 [Plodia interpunctella]
MEQGKNSSHRHCIVPTCENTIKNSPNKVFFPVPRDVDMKKKWCEAVHKDMASFTRLYCCEDHFDLEQDTSNYMAYKIMNLQENKKTLLRLRKGVVPHIFACQEDTHCPSDKCFTKSESSQMDLEGSRSSSPSQEMSPNLVCRLCLAVEVRLFTITGSLQDVYEKLTDTALHSLDARPLAACYLCHAQLRKCRRLMLGSARAEALLTDMLRTSSKISLKAVSSIDRFANGLCSLNFSKAECLESVSPQFVTPEIKSETESDSEDRGADGPASDGRDPGPDGGEALSAPHQEEDIKQEPQLEEDVAPTKTTGADSTTDSKERASGSKSKTAKKTRGPRQCDVCHRQCRTASELKKHYVVHTGEKPYKCEVCERQFTWKASLSKHILTHTGEKPYKCDVCSKGFIKKSNLVIHLRSHTGEKPFECAKCQQRFSNQCNLSRHMRIHTGEKRFQCDLCDKRFYQKAHVVSHLKSHTGEKPYKCKLCGHRVSQKNNLLNHLRTHTGEKPFKCELCETEFNQKQSWLCHLKSHSNYKPFGCSICQYRCKQKGALVGHMRTHTGEKPFACELCERRFSFKRDVARHMLTHTGEKPFVCHVCPRRFTQKVNLLRHLQTHEK